MAWNQQQFEANVKAGLIPADCRLYGHGAESVVTNTWGQPVPGAVGHVFRSADSDVSLSVWVDVDTEFPRQVQDLTANERGVLPVFAVPGLPFVWVNFGEGLVCLHPWDTELRVSAFGARFAQNGMAPILVLPALGMVPEDTPRSTPVLRVNREAGTASLSLWTGSVEVPLKLS